MIDSAGHDGESLPKRESRRKIRLAVEIGEEEELSTTPSFDVSYPSDARKLEIISKNPLVPAGALLTAAVLMGGLFAFKNGSQRWSQRMMRARVLAQGATLAVLAHSVYDRALPKKPVELDPYTSGIVTRLEAPTISTSDATNGSVLKSVIE